MKYDEKEVLKAIDGNKEAFEELYKSIYMDLYKMAFYILGNGEQAKDVVSETVLDAYLGIKKMKDASKLEQWILRILTVKCKRNIREKYEKITVFNPKVSNIDEHSVIRQDNCEDIELKSDIQLAMRKLKKDERVIISLCVVQGYKSHEVAEILSMNASTVRSKLNRGLNKMKKYLEV